MERLKLKVAVYLILIKENKILLVRRFNTGWQDGNYSLPSGHLDPNETIIDAMVRETKEEIGIDINPADLKLVHTMHRISIYIDFYFTASVWSGEVKNTEPDKCDDVQWFPIDDLPVNIVATVKSAIKNYQQGISFSEMNPD